MSSSYNSDVGGKGGKKIYDAIKAEDIFFWSFNGDDPKDIFYGKNAGNDPFCYIELHIIDIVQIGNAFQHYKDDAKYNYNEQDNVKCLSHLGIRLINYFMKSGFPT